ncbi:MAG TPA: hypothetical protein PLD25_02280 [Chloroflexota bacterium]|nr:hypothetical protein [Chloroflexota bacterium]HUM69677.1 hypothetical protein [Chloroflexota bacterium]
MSNSTEPYLIMLHNLLVESFNLEEFRQLCLFLNINDESIPGGEVLPAKLRGLMLRLAREGRLPELVTLAATERPGRYWPPVPADFQLPKSGPWSDATAGAGQTIVQGDLVYGDKAGGDIVGRDKITASGQGIAIGDHARAEVHIQQGIPPEQLTALFAPLLQQVAQQAPAGQQAEAVAKVNELKEEAAKGETADDEKVAELVQDVVDMVPTAVEGITNLFTNAIIAKSAGAATKFVLKRLRRA